MKKSERLTINRASANVTRQSSEPEDIDLAAEATEAAPAKSLQPERKSRSAATRSRAGSRKKS